MSQEKQTYLTGPQWARIVAKAWLEPDFRTKLETSPGDAIREEFGFDFERVFKIPDKPDDIDDEQLDSIKSGDKPGFFYPYDCGCC